MLKVYFVGQFDHTDLTWAQKEEEWGWSLKSTCECGLSKSDFSDKGGVQIMVWLVGLESLVTCYWKKKASSWKIFFSFFFLNRWTLFSDGNCLLFICNNTTRFLVWSQLVSWYLSYWIKKDSCIDIWFVLFCWLFWWFLDESVQDWRCLYIQPENKFNSMTLNKNQEVSTVLSY